MEIPLESKLYYWNWFTNVFYNTQLMEKQFGNRFIYKLELKCVMSSGITLKIKSELIYT